jgi:hypothetical protein
VSDIMETLGSHLCQVENISDDESIRSGDVGNSNPELEREKEASFGDSKDWAPGTNGDEVRLDEEEADEENGSDDDDDDEGTKRYWESLVKEGKKVSN